MAAAAMTNASTLESLPKEIIEQVLLELTPEDVVLLSTITDKPKIKDASAYIIHKSVEAGDIDFVSAIFKHGNRAQVRMAKDFIEEMYDTYGLPDGYFVHIPGSDTFAFKRLIVDVIYKISEFQSLVKKSGGPVWWRDAAGQLEFKPYYQLNVHFRGGHEYNVRAGGVSPTYELRYDFVNRPDKSRVINYVVDPTDDAEVVSKIFNHISDAMNTRRDKPYKISIARYTDNGRQRRQISMIGRAQQR